MNFFDKLLPQEGLVCVAKALKKGFQHYFFEDRQAAQDKIIELDAAGHTVFLAQATFDTDVSRKQDNALALKNFFLDIDCGEGKPYTTQRDGVTALKKMLAETGLPMPAVVNSGNGLYAHWFLAKAIPAAQWKATAHVFKKTLEAYGFQADPARTSDSSSVLRPPGATNRKHGEEKPVHLVNKTLPDPIEFMEFSKLILTAAKKKQVNVQVLKAPKAVSDINAEFLSGVEGPRPFAENIAEKCNQVKLFKQAQGDVSEPIWYSMVGLLSFCEASDDEADVLIQEWSSGHSDYSASATTDKITQFRAAEVGPATCAHLGSLNASGCVGCRQNGKIKSPIVLGRPEPAEIDQPEEDIAPPSGFRRAEDGLYFEEEGIWHRFYDCDLAPTQLAFDQSLGYEVATIRHTLPYEGDLEFVIRSSDAQDTKTLITCFADNHVKVCGVKEKKAMANYIEGYILQLQRNRKMSQLLCQMGWRTDHTGKDFFVLGKNVYYQDGTCDEAALARNVPDAAKGYTAKGDRSLWVNATAIFDKPRMEPFAFALLSAFAAPLMKFTGFSGAVVSMTGESGVGKTLMLRIAQSVYGYHDTLMMYKEDTRNAMVSRLGVYGSLPLTVDEITNIDNQDLSDLVYRVTQGRDKVRLTKNSEERKIINGWNTLAIVSTNSAIVDKLSGLKYDATAEMNRVFEYPVEENPNFVGEVTSDLYWLIDENYGMAGQEYIAWLAQHIHEIKPGLEKIRKKIEGTSNIRGEERFWSAVASAAIYGGLVAKSLGLIKFDVAHIMLWATKAINSMRSEKEDLTGSSIDILGQFLDEHAANKLIVKGDCAFGKVAIVIDPPRGALYIRHEVDNHKIFISRALFKTWIGRKFGSYSKIMKDLKEVGALRDANIKKVLGAGTHFGGAQQPCWLIDLKCPQLGAVGLALVKEAKLLDAEVM